MTIQKLADGYRATVKINGQEYVATLRISPDLAAPEIAIYKTRRGRVSKWRPIPVYTAWPEKISQDTLRKHIFLFAATNP